MDIKICVSHPDDALEKFRPKDDKCSWELVLSGFWSQGPYNSGHVAYFIANTREGIWLLDCVERNACLDGVTEEDVADGALDDDQIQAMWGMTLEEAQDKEYCRVVAVCENAPKDSCKKVMAQIMYDEVRKNSPKAVGEADDYGLIDQI